MSDFLFAHKSQRANTLADILATLTWVAPESVYRFEGTWGSLAVSKNLHRGFQPYETDSEIAIVIGGPLPKLASVDGPGINDDNRGTATIARRLFHEKSGDWHLDLLAPCCFFHLDKRTGVVTIVTDEMSFIPAYTATAGAAENGHHDVLSTHPDAAALAVAEGKTLRIDPVSACDLVIHRVITYPHTLHENVRELPPGSIHTIQPTSIASHTYWQPSESRDKYPRLRDAAREGREALVEVVERAAAYYGSMGLLLSAGEDSRAIACMVPKGTPLHCFTAAPSENREMRIAGRVAAALGASWESRFLNAEDYFKELGRRSLFTGSNSTGAYAHFVGAMQDSPLHRQGVVLGGLKSDTFLKAHYLKTKNLVRGIDYKVVDNRRPKLQSEFLCFSKELVLEVASRKRLHREWVSTFLPDTADNWTAYWPMSQDYEIGNFWSTRRMLPMLEVFTTARILDLVAAVPVKWTLNRRLFQAIAASHLQKLWWLPHGEGHFPWLPWYVNVPVTMVGRMRRALSPRETLDKAAAWPTLGSYLRSEAASVEISRLRPYVSRLPGFACSPTVMNDERWSSFQQYAYVQIMAMMEEFDIASGKFAGH